MRFVASGPHPGPQVRLLLADCVFVNCRQLQVKYVVELARAISRHPAVHRVELLTRLIADPKASAVTLHLGIGYRV